MMMRWLPQFRAVLWTMFGGMLLVCAYDVTLCALAPCPFREVGSRTAMAEERCLDDIYRIMIVRAPVILFIFVTITAHAGYRIWRILGYQRHRLPRRLAEAMHLKTRADLWVAAASRDLFQETVRSLRSSNVIVGFLLLPFAAVIATSSLVGGFTDLPTTYDDPKVVKMCQSVGLCHACFAFAAGLVTLNVLILLLISIPLHTVPPMVWGRSMELATEKTGKLRVRRLMLLPYFSVGGYASCMFQVVHHQTRIITTSASPVESIMLLGIQSVTLLYLLGIMFWVSLVPWDVMSKLRQLWSEARVLHQPLGSGLSRRGQTEVIQQDACCERGRDLSPVAEVVTLPMFQRVVAWMGENQETSANQRKEVLLFVSLLLWAQRVVARAPLWQCILVFLLRGVAIALLLTTREATSGFDSIAQEPGFGLVVEAKSLCRALRCVLNGHQPLPTHLPRYKATLQRMQDAAAVSYRWQPMERQISGDCCLNMNEYQMECLLDALPRSRAKFVWLDRLSVPQHDCSLKYTILARMMAVYAAAKCTIALRTMEPDGSRYHQRAWTFQEFCASCNLCIRTEKDTDGSSDGERCAVADGEDEVAMDLRSRFQASINDVTPFWLRSDGIDAGVAKKLVRECLDLGVKLSCQVAGDKVRALLPLLTHTPVEGQGELIALVLRVSSASGRDLQDWKSALLDQHMTVRKLNKIGSGRRPPPPPSHGEKNSVGHSIMTESPASSRLVTVSPVQPRMPVLSTAGIAKSSFLIGTFERQADVGSNGLEDGNSKGLSDLKRCRSDFVSRQQDEALSGVLGSVSISPTSRKFFASSADSIVPQHRGRVVDDSARHVEPATVAGAGRLSLREWPRAITNSVRMLF